MGHEPRIYPQVTGTSVVEYTDIGNKKKYIEFKSDQVALEFADALCGTRKIATVKDYKPFKVI